MSDSPDENFDPAALESLLHDVPLDVTIELGRTRLNISELAARLGPARSSPSINRPARHSTCASTAA